MDAHEKYHRQRIMFCITHPDHVIHVAKLGDPRDHEKWFTDEGWIQGDPEQFLLTTTRGFYYPETNCLYTYFGRDFSFDKDTIMAVWTNIRTLRDLLGFNEHTQIAFGPKDKSFRGRSYRQLSYGTMLEFEGKIYDLIN